MWSNKSKEVLLQNPRHNQNKDSTRDLSAAWATFSQTKAALCHIENKLEIPPTSTAAFGSVMDAKKPSTSAGRKISRKASHSSSQNKSSKEKSSRSPLRATTLESNVKKSSRVEFCEPLVSFRDTYNALSYHGFDEFEDTELLSSLGLSEVEEKDEMTDFTIDEQDLFGRNFESPSSSAADETVVRYLNDRPTIDALQNSEAFRKVAIPPRLEELKNGGSRGEEITKAPQNNTSVDNDLKVSSSSARTTNTHRLELLKGRQHDVKLEKLKERIRKQWENSDGPGGRGQHSGCAEQPVVITNVESAVTPKVRKVAAAPAAPAYRGFNPVETKIRAPDGKVWHGEGFRISRELYRDITLQLTEDSRVTEKPTEKNKDKKTTRPVRKVQKLARLASPESKHGGNYISASSWREGQKLAKKILGPAPRIEQDRRAVSSDRTGQEQAAKSGSIGRTGSDSRLDATHKTSRSSERSRSKIRSGNKLTKPEAALSDGNQADHAPVNKDFLPVEIRGILDDLQLDSMTTKQEKNVEKQNEKPVLPTQNTRSHSPTKRKPDKIAAVEEPQVISKKRHYDTDEVRQFIIRQQEERKKKRNEEKKAQKEATEQKNKRLQELYRKQKEAFTKVKNVPPSEPSAAKQLQETYSKLLLEPALPEEPPQLPTVQEAQPKPGYQPSGESDKENKAQERPPSASSSSDMSLSEPQQPLLRSDLMEPPWVQPERLSPKVQISHKQAVMGSSGGPCSQHWSLEQMNLSSKECEAMLPGRRCHAAPGGSSTMMPQPYLNSAAQLNPVVKPTANQYKSKLDRIEALKATAASLSSRIENEAKKLAGAGMNYGATWNSDHEFMQKQQGDGRWAKAVSPPVREENKDAFSARIQKMLDACVSHTAFDDSLPGVGNLSEFKKLPETIRPHTAAVSLGMKSPAANRHEEILGQLSQRRSNSLGRESQAYTLKKAILFSDSSVASTSEGPILSDGSLTDDEGSDQLGMLETLSDQFFCVHERNAFEPIKEFQKEAEKYLPVFTQTNGVQSKGPWEELAKGSPHSVINIFAKNCQLHGKVFDEKLNGDSNVMLPLLPTMSTPESMASYEDDFASLQESNTLTDKKIPCDLSVAGSNTSSIKEEVPSRKSAYEPLSAELASPCSSGARSATSSRSSGSSKKRGKKERKCKLESSSGSSHHFTVEEGKIPSESERGSQQTKKSLSSGRVSSRDHEQNPDIVSMLENTSGNSLKSFSDKGRSQKTQTSSPPPGSQKLLQFDSVANTAERVKSPASFSGNTTSGMKSNAAFPDLSMGTNRSGAGAAPVSGCLHFTPTGLQQHFSAEFNYFSAMEESARQLSDVERLRGIALAQQESVSLAQILKAQQQRHERDLALLKIKAEQEALGSQRQLGEARQKAAQVQSESVQHRVQARQDAVQETSCKAAAKQAEAAHLNTDAADCEMTELVRTQVSDPVCAPATSLFDQQRQHHLEFLKQMRARSEANRKCESAAISQVKEETVDLKQSYSSIFDSYSESSRSKVHDQSSTSSRHESPSAPSSKENEKKLSCREKLSSSIEEQAHTAADDSLPSDSILSLPDEKDSASVATEYSLKFDESMTEDEIEEKSFRSLLPSESHRRNNLEKKRGNRDDSDEEVSPEKTALSSVKELSMPFSGDQDSFSKFTMEMVRQYMREEEMRAAHQSSLLRLREKALKEKTKAELAWLEHQKKHLRDKGEDDKMPPIRKRQRSLLLRLQQEKAEIKRLQEANKAARKERQLILKQQEEIERIQQTTIKLQEKLKSAGENKLELPSEDDIKQSNTSSPLPTDGEARSPSPVSISSSETSSIMQKLKKMRSRMDEKFLTKREQKLMQRRQHAEELLEWKRRLDAEEAEVRRIEKQALAAWDKELLKTKTAKKDLGDQRTEPKETASEEDLTVPSFSHLNGESSIPEDLGSPAADSIPSETMGHVQPESPDQNTADKEMVYSEESKSSTSPGKSSPPKSSISVSKQDSSKGSHRTEGQLRSPVKSQISHSWSDESLSMTQSETTSDQSDIEGRIRALKDELRKRKSVVYQLKKEQKKRQKERLKAQEASLIKQLESYDEFIKKTEAELSQDLEASPTARPQIKTLSSAAAEKPKIKAPPLHRPEKAKNWKSLAESEHSRASLESISENGDAVSSRTEKYVHTKKVAVTDVHAEEPSGTSSSDLMSPRSSRERSANSLDIEPSSFLLKDIKDISKISHGSVNNVVKASSDEDAFSHTSEIQEDLEYIKSEEYEIEGSHVKPLETSDVLLMLEKEQETSLDILPKKILHSENDLSSQKELLSLAVESLHGTEEFLEQIVTNEDAVTGPCVEESSHKLSKSAEEKDHLISEQLFIQKEPSYLEDFERSSSRQQASVEETILDYKDDFESSVLSSNEDAQLLAEQSLHTQSNQNRSSSLGSDDEISEFLSDRSPSLSGSVQSERLLELKSPTELIKNTERSDVEQEQAPTESPLWAPVSVTEEADSMPDFNIGDRVLVSEVQPGTLRFKGLTKFAKGLWAGVELDKPEGNNNGTYDGFQYFDCKERHGIFAPPQKISHLTESIDNYLDATKDKDSFFDDRLEKQHEAEQKDRQSSKPGKEDEGQSKESYSQAKAPVETHAVSEASSEEEIDEELPSEASSIKEISPSAESLAQEQSVVDYLKHAIKEETNIAPLLPDVVDETVVVQLDNIADILSEKLERQKTLGEECVEKLDDLSPEVEEKSETPLLDLLTKEKNQLEAQLQEEEKSKDQLEKVSLLTDSLLKDFLKDTVSQLQQIKKVKNEKIQLSNQELCDVKGESCTSSQQPEEQIPNGLDNLFLNSDLDDEKEELSSPDMCPRPESPVFGASGQEELAKRLAELELNREFLSVLGDDQDWFDEDYGLSSHEDQQKQAEEPAVLPKVEAQKVPMKPCEELLAVPHTAVEVEGMVHEAVEELWKLKELGHDLQSFSLHTDFDSTPQEHDIDTISKQVYKKVVFDLTREIFGEIFAEDPNLNQPVWMKPCRISSAYFRRVKDPNNLNEIKSFIAAEVLKLFSLRKEPNHKMDWQKMMKFGRKKRDRVDQILAQELHEEEAQWVNYDEDELCVKMQLADGIFEALIRDTVDVLNQIYEKRRLLLA